jgi:enamine deaminase RidA (YjgF/YER057c/UK114 family)
MDIRRIEIIPPPAPIVRSRCVIHGDTVYLGGLTDEDSTRDIKEQTKRVLERIDMYLAEAGTNKSRILRAQIWLKNMTDFVEMNSVWNAWVDPESPPARACVSADMARPGTLVEIMVTAAQ